MYARWTALSNRSATARYVVTHQGGTATVTQNQQANGATWNLLGTWTFAPGQGVRLEASDSGYVIADALRFTPSADQPSTGGLFYIHPDHLGTPRAITKPADNALVWRWENAEPFGNSIPNENPSGLGSFVYNLRFPGQYFDMETGLHYNYFRDYDPAIGRYVQSDPAGLIGGLNTYGYVGARPLALIDPWGLAPGGGRSWRPQPSPPVPLPWDPGFGPNNCSHYPVPALRKICGQGAPDNPNMNCARKCLAVYWQGIDSPLDGAFWLFPQHPVCWWECRLSPPELCKALWKAASQ